MIVMKFGGTSVGDAKAIDRVSSHRAGAFGGNGPWSWSAPWSKVTDTLLTMARAAGAGERKAALKLCRSLQERTTTPPANAGKLRFFTQFHAELGADFEALDEFAARHLGRR